MNIRHFLIFTLLYMPLCTLSKRPSQSKPGRKENAKIVLSNLAHIIGHIGTIMDNPHDAENVGDSVANIVENIVKITMNAVHNKSINITEAQHIMDELYDLCDKLDPAITRRIVLRTRLC